MRLERVTVWLIAVGCLTTVVEGQKSFWVVRRRILDRRARPIRRRFLRLIC